MKKQTETKQLKSNKFFAISIVAALLVVVGVAGFVLYNRPSEIIIDIDPIPSDDPDPTEDPIVDPEEPTVYDDLSVLFHQSYENDTTQSLNSSESSFTVDVPSDAEFNASNTEIEVSDVELFDHTIYRETSASEEIAGSTNMLVASIKIDSNAILTNISAYGRVLGDYSFVIYNATIVNGIPVPDGTPALNYYEKFDEIFDGVSTNRWYSLNQTGNPKLLLNNSLTEGGYFFIGVICAGYRWTKVTNLTQYNYQWSSSTSVWVQKNSDYSIQVELSPFETSELIENSGTTFDTTQQPTRDNPFVASFTIPSDCYIKNISILGTITSDLTLRYYIFNSTVENSNIPNTLSNYMYLTTEAQTTTAEGLLSLKSDPNWKLETSKTQNNTFFLGIGLTSIGGVRWAYTSETDTQNVSRWGGSAWVERAIDVSFNITFSTPIADITINNSAIENGLWQSSEQFNTNTQFVLGGWNNFSANINRVQMNFTKTFNVSIEELESSLRVVIPVSGFESAFGNQYVRVTIDESFEITSITYNGAELLEDDFERSGVNVFIYADFSESANLVFSFPIAAKQEE